MSFQSSHPQYDEITNDLRQMRDVVKGSRAIKEGMALYLPATASHILDGANQGQEPGYSSYQSYLARAVFPDHVAEALHTMVGILNREPYEIEVPKRLEEILGNATRENETLGSSSERSTQRS